MEFKEGGNTTERGNPQTGAELSALYGEINTGNQPEHESQGDASSLDLQELYEQMGIKSEQDPRFKDLISLGIKENANISYTKLRQIVKTINDVEKINEQNIGEFLDIDQDVPQENYHYIVNNFKEIITKHLKYYPERKSFLSGGVATFPAPSSLQKMINNDLFVENTVNILNQIEKKSEEEQRNYVIQHLDNPALVDFWLKSKLSTLQGGETAEKNTQNQEKSERDVFIESFFKEIPFDKLDAYFKSAERSPFLKSLGENLLNCQAEKENLIIKTDKFVLLDVFDLKSNLKCQKLADYSEKIGGNDQEYSVFAMMNATLEMKKMFKALGTDENKIPYIDKKILTTKEGLKVLSEFLNAQNTLPQEIEKIKNHYQNLTREVTKQYGGGQAVQGFMRAKEKEITAAQLNFEKSYVKLLLESGHKPTGIITGPTGLKLDFSKGNNVDDIVRDSFTEHVEDGRDKFLDDLKNDKQNAFGAIGGLIGGTIGTGAMAILTQGSNPWLMSAGYTVGSRLGNGITQEARNTGERILQQCGADIKNNEAGVGVVDKNGVQNFGLSFSRGVGWLDQNYQAVGWENFLIDLGGDYLSGVASFGLSNKIFGGNISGYIKNTTKEIVQEIGIDSTLFDYPAEIMKAGTKAFFKTQGYENNPGTLNTMINTADECYSIENFSYTFCHTVTSCGFLGAVHKPLNYVTNRLTRPLFENSLDQQFKEIQQRTKALAEYMKQQGLELHRNYIIKNKHKIDENSDIFKYIKAEIQRINSLQNQYIEMANAAKELQQKIKEGNDIDGLLLKHDLISPFNTPSNILNQKINEAQNNLQQAQRNNNQQDITKYEGLLAEYQKVKEKLDKDYFNGEKRTEYGITTEQAEANSAFMDDQIEQLNSSNEGNVINAIREHIIEQYEKATGKKIENHEKFLPNGAIYAIIDAHTQAGQLGNLTFQELRNKYNILAEIFPQNKYENFVRFLLEFGFGGSYGKKREIPTAEQTFRKYESKGVTLYIENKQIDHVDSRHANDLLPNVRCFNDKTEIQQVAELFGQGLTDFLEDLKNSPNEWNTLNRQEGDPKNNIKYILVNTKDEKYKSLIVQVQIGKDNNFRVVSFYTPKNKDFTHLNPYLVCDIDTSNTTKRTENSDYFDGKESRFGFEENEVYANSEFMDTMLEEINNHPESLKNCITNIKERIEEQYRKKTQQELNLSDEQVLSIIDAHEQDGILGELTIGQLYRKVKILAESITDEDTRGLLLEGGFCGRTQEREVRESIYNQELMQNFNTYLFSEGKKMLNIAYDKALNQNDIKVSKDEKGNIISISIKNGGLILQKDQLELKSSQKLWDQLTTDKTPNDIKKIQDICKKKASYLFLNLFDLPTEFITENTKPQLDEFFRGENMINVLLDNRTELGEQSKNEALNEIFGRCLCFCLQEHIPAEHLFQKFKPFIKEQTATSNDGTLTTPIQKLESSLKDAGDNPKRANLIFQETFEVTEDNLKEFFNGICSNKEQFQDDEIKFFMRNLFMSSQIQWDPAIKRLEAEINDIRADNSLYQKFAKENGFKFIGSMKSTLSVLVKLSKDRKYSRVEDLDDLKRATYLLDESGDPDTDIKNLLINIGKFAETVLDDPKTQFDCKFKNLLEKGDSGYKYITAFNPDTGEIETLPDKNNTTHKFYIDAKKFLNSSIKTSSGDKYADIKIRKPFEIKFMTKQWFIDNEYGTNDHGVMRTIDHINKESRQKGFISDTRIKQHVRDFLQRYNTTSGLKDEFGMEVKVKEKFMAELAEQFHVQNNPNAITEALTQYVFSKYTKIGEKNEHNFYVSNNGYLNVAFKEYLKSTNQQIPEEWITEYKKSLPQGHKDLDEKTKKEDLQYRARLYHQFTNREGSPKK